MATTSKPNDDVELFGYNIIGSPPIANKSDVREQGKRNLFPTDDDGNNDRNIITINKKKKVFYEIKSDVLGDGMDPVNLCSSHPELFVETLQGNIDLVWCQDGTREGYVDPFNKAFFDYDKKNPNAVKVFQQLKKKTGIFAAASRRVSKESNEPEMKEGKHGGMFKTMYYIRHHGWNDGSDESDKRACLDCLAEFLTESNAKSREGSPIKPKAYKVPIDFDYTRLNKLPTWDERLTDCDVARVMKMMYKPTPTEDFAKSSCSTVGAHFSKPYSNIAKNMFGFGFEN